MSGVGSKWAGGRAPLCRDAAVLPFDVDEFFAVFAAYNAAVWPAQWLLYGIAVAALLLTTSQWRLRHRTISALLAFLWIWMALAYHLFAFARINPAAYLFAAAFLIEAGVLLWSGLKARSLEYSIRQDGAGYAALAMLLYALAVYPALNRMTEHMYPSAPTFGVPCPTTIFTLGLLTLARGPGRAVALAIPLLWSVVGGSAAFLLDVPQDLGLLGAGMLTFALALRELRGKESRG